MVNKKSLVQLTSRFIAYFFLIAAIITISVLVYQFGPSRSLYSDDDWEDAEKVDIPGYNETLYKGVMDQHSHTYYSDGVLSVKQNIEWHIAMGFNVIFITDHDSLNNMEAVKKAQEEYEDEDVVIIQGMEWTTNRIHMNFLGLSEWDLPIPDNPTDEEIQEAIDEAHDQGAIVICNHFLWSINEAGMEEHPSREDLLEWGIDYIEVINRGTRSENSYDEESVEFCEKEDIGQITGTDMHTPDYFAVNAWTLLNVSELTEDAVMEELKYGRTKIHISNVSFVDPGKHRENPWYALIEPLDRLGGDFRALWIGGYEYLDWVGVLVYFTLFMIIFAVIEIYRAYKPKFWNKIHQRKKLPKPKSGSLKEANINDNT